MIATVDVAREAAALLARPHVTGFGVRPLLGPGDRSMREATRALGAAMGLPDLPYVEFPPEGVRAALIEAGLSEQGAAVLVELQEAINEGRVLDGVERTPETTTPTHLEEFLKEAVR